MKALFCISNHVSTPQANIKNELQFPSKGIDSKIMVGINTVIQIIWKQEGPEVERVYKELKHSLDTLPVNNEPSDQVHECVCVCEAFYIFLNKEFLFQDLSESIQ